MCFRINFIEQLKLDDNNQRLGQLSNINKWLWIIGCTAKKASAAFYVCSDCCICGDRQKKPQEGARGDDTWIDSSPASPWKEADFQGEGGNTMEWSVGAFNSVISKPFDLFEGD